MVLLLRAIPKSKGRSLGSPQIVHKILLKFGNKTVTVREGKFNTNCVIPKLQNIKQFKDFVSLRGATKVSDS